MLVSSSNILRSVGDLAILLPFAARSFDLQRTQIVTSGSNAREQDDFENNLWRNASLEFSSDTAAMNFECRPGWEKPLASFVNSKRERSQQGAYKNSRKNKQPRQ